MSEDKSSDKANVMVMSDSVENDSGLKASIDLAKEQTDGTIDDATLFVQERKDLYPDVSEAEEKKAIRKNDWCLLLPLFLLCTSGATDKVSLGTAALYGLREDCNLTDPEYAWVNSIIFIGSLVACWPMSYLMSKYPNGKLLAICGVSWSICTLCLPACHNYGSLMGVRFLMGVFEAAIVPGATLIVGKFYLKKEQPARLGLVFAFGSSVINGFLSWLVGNFDDSLPKWKYLFIFVGAISLGWCGFMLWFLPDSPMNAVYLTDKQRYIMTKRVMDNKTGVVSHKFKPYQMVQAFLDVKTYIIFVFNILINLPNGGLSAFNGILIASLGFDAKQSSLMTIPTGVIATLSTVFFNYLCHVTDNKRTLLSAISLVVPIIGGAISYAVDDTNVAGRLVGLYFMYFYFCSYVIMISLSSANTAGSTKRSSTIYFNYVGYTVGALTGSHIFESGFETGFAIMLAAYAVNILLSGLYWLVCTIENKRKQKVIDNDKELQLEAEREKELSDEDKLLLDLTDREQKTFMYTR